MSHKVIEIYEYVGFDFFITIDTIVAKKIDENPFKL